MGSSEEYLFQPISTDAVQCQIQWCVGWTAKNSQASHPSFGKAPQLDERVGKVSRSNMLSEHKQSDKT